MHLTVNVGAQSAHISVKTKRVWWTAHIGVDVIYTTLTFHIVSSMTEAGVWIFMFPQSFDQRG